METTPNPTPDPSENRVNLLPPVIKDLRLWDKSVHIPEGIPISPDEPVDPEKLQQVEDRMNDPSTRLGALCAVLESGADTSKD